MLNTKDENWVSGRVSLGAAADWTSEEIRLIAELGFALAEYGRDDEALTVFEGLAALAPATAYFQSALGALKLRTGDLAGAVVHLNAALAADSEDLASLVNRGELFMKLNEDELAVNDFITLLQLPKVTGLAESSPYAIRARALLSVLMGGAAFTAK
jgi:Flp pilus assembly protein TadD